MKSTKEEKTGQFPGTQVYLDPETKKIAQAQGKKMALSMSAYIRMLIRRDADAQQGAAPRG